MDVPRTPTIAYKKADWQTIATLLQCFHMKLSEPIGNNMWSGFFVRVALGCYFVGTGLTTLDRLQAFEQEIRGMNVLPPHLATLYAISLPYLQVGCGSLLVLGIWTTAAAVVSAALL